MKCDRMRILLKTDYLDGELTGKTRFDVEEHLGICPACRQFKEKLEEQRAFLRTAEPTAVPPRIWNNIQSAIVEKRLAEENTAPMRLLKTLRESLFAGRRRLAVAAISVSLILIIGLSGIYMIGGILERAKDIFSEYRINGDLIEYSLGTDLEKYFL